MSTEQTLTPDDMASAAQEASSTIGVVFTRLWADAMDAADLTPEQRRQVSAQVRRRLGDTAYLEQAAAAALREVQADARTTPSHPMDDRREE